MIFLLIIDLLVLFNISTISIYATKYCRVITKRRLISSSSTIFSFSRKRLAKYDLQILILVKTIKLFMHIYNILLLQSLDKLTPHSIYENAPCTLVVNRIYIYIQTHTKLNIFTPTLFKFAQCCGSFWS